MDITNRIKKIQETTKPDAENGSFTIDSSTGKQPEDNIPNHNTKYVNDIVPLNLSIFSRK